MPIVLSMLALTGVENSEEFNENKYYEKHNTYSLGSAD